MGQHEVNGKCWEVLLDDFPTAVVKAENWEQATVEAAKYWGIPWGRFAAYMRQGRTWEARKNVCLKCKKIFYGPGELCPKCELARRQDEENIRTALKKSWYLGKKREY